MNTAKFDYIEVSRTLEAKQRQMYFALGSMIYSAKTTNRGYAANMDMCHELAFADLDPFNQMLAVTETAAHLDLLVAQGRLRCSELDGVVHYTHP